MRRSVKICIVLVLMSCVVMRSWAHTLTVGSGKQFRTIKAALVRSVDRDTILVYAGVYKEGNLIIDKEIALIGISKPILDGERKYEVLSIKADRVTVKGFVVKNVGVSSIIDYAGIKAYECKYTRIEDNQILDAFFGIYIQMGVGAVIKNNQLVSHAKEEQQSGNGIHCWKSDSLQIIANKISGHRDGIYFEFVTSSVIWRNISTENIRYGLHFMFSNNDAYMSNVFEKNGAGVAVMFSKNVKMFHNYFKENWGDASYGILLKEIADSYIEGNHFEQNTSGIYLEGVSRVQLTRNIFQNNGWALKIQASCMEIEVRNNNFIGNTFDVGTNGSLVLNHFENNYWDKYEGYDINKDKKGDVPYRPVSLYSVIVEKNPPAMILFRSFITALMDKTEKMVPSLTPENLKDDAPVMKPFVL